MKTEKQDIRILCKDTTVSFFAKIKTFLENFSLISDWTKPLRGSVALDIVVIRKL